MRDTPPPRSPVALATFTLAAPLLLLASTGCFPAASEGGLQDPNPASRLYAIRRAGEQRDLTAMPRLVEQLDHDDPAVRVTAILALERMTGERLGYNPYANTEERAHAVDRWEQAVREGRFTSYRTD